MNTPRYHVDSVAKDGTLQGSDGPEDGGPPFFVFDADLQRNLGAWDDYAAARRIADELNAANRRAIDWLAKDADNRRNIMTDPNIKATVLAALRFWQAQLETGRPAWGERLQEIHAIAAEGGMQASPEDIDDLCEAINTNVLRVVGSLTEADKPKRWYVTMTWDDWPEGGSYGTVIEGATDEEEAESLCRREMACVSLEGEDPETCIYNDEDIEDQTSVAADEARISNFMEEYADEWEVIDCFNLDDFIARHQR